MAGHSLGKGLIMKETGKNDNDLLYSDIVSLFNSYFGNVLDILSTRFPHISGDNSNNEHQYRCLRSKILRAGNDKIRNELVGIIKNYSSVKLFNTDIKRISVGQRIK